MSLSKKKKYRESKGLNPSGRYTTARHGPYSQAYEGGKFGWGTPPELERVLSDIRKPEVRSSPVATLTDCPRLFCYQYKMGIRPRQYESALSMGSTVHKILQCLVSGQTPDEAMEVCERIYQKEQERVVGLAGLDGFLPSGESVEIIVKKMEEDYHKARACGLAFWSFVPFDKDRFSVLQNPDGEPMIEMLLSCDFRGISRPVTAMCDIALVDKEDGGVWIVDYKTTSFDPRKRAVPTKISPQLAIYRLCLQAHLDLWTEEGRAPKQTVKGSYHAIIKKPGIKFCKKDVNFAAYIERVIQWYRDLDAKDPENPPLILDPNLFSGPAMTAELFGRLKEFCRAAHAAPNIHAFYRAGESTCLRFNKVCPYMPLCASDPVMWSDLIEQRYEIRYREDTEGEDV